MNFPEDLKYTKDHEWVRVDGTTAIVGITEHAQSELGDVVYVDVPDAAATVAAGDSVGTIEAVKTVADIYSPVSGTITDVNAVNDGPDIVNRDPYGDGWLLRMTMSNPAELDGLMSASDYKALIGQ
jgi:glycine cleavage system H protein